MFLIAELVADLRKVVFRLCVETKQRLEQRLTETERVLFRHADTVAFLRLKGPGEILRVHAHERLAKRRVERPEPSGLQMPLVTDSRPPLVLHTGLL